MISQAKLFIRILLISIIIFGIYSVIYLPNVLKTEYVKYDFKGEEKLKIVHLSDIHISIFYPEKKLKKIIEKVNKEEPDIIVFTGDLFDRKLFFKEKEKGLVSGYLNEFEAKYGKFAIRGNHDYQGNGFFIFEETIVNGGFTLLDNEGVNIELDNGKKIFVGGSDDFLYSKPNLNSIVENQDQGSAFNLLLIHEPDPADYFVGFDYDLILAGHSHGGQIVLPFFQFKNNLAVNYVDGLYDTQGSIKLYVNSGIGTSLLPIRFGVAPKIVVHEVSID